MEETPRTFRQFPVLLFALLLCIDTVVMIFYKLAEIHAHGEGLAYYYALMTGPWVWVGLGGSLLQLWTWTQILARTDLSLAYPFSSLAYPITMITAVVLFHEQLTLQVWLGALFITIGVAIIGRGHAKAHITGDPILG